MGWDYEDFTSQAKEFGFWYDQQWIAYTWVRGATWQKQFGSRRQGGWKEWIAAAREAREKAVTAAPSSCRQGSAGETEPETEPRSYERSDKRGDAAERWDTGLCCGTWCYIFWNQHQEVNIHSVFMEQVRLNHWGHWEWDCEDWKYIARQGIKTNNKLRRI